MPLLHILVSTLTTGGEEEPVEPHMTKKLSPPHDPPLVPIITVGTEPGKETIRILLNASIRDMFTIGGGGCPIEFQASNCFKDSRVGGVLLSLKMRKADSPFDSCFGLLSPL